MIVFDIFLEAVLNPSVAKSKSPSNRDRNRANFTECYVEFLR